MEEKNRDRRGEPSTRFFVSARPKGDGVAGLLGFGHHTDRLQAGKDFRKNGDDVRNQLLNKGIGWIHGVSPL